MLDALNSINADLNTTNPQSARGAKVLKMVKNNRMGGYVPAWVTLDNTPAPDLDATSQIEKILSHAQNGENPHSFEAALAYQNAAGAAPNNTPQNRDIQEFGFGDIIDMVNPLHHIPVVGDVYRNITGDTIKPASKVMGGTLFGGPIGAVSGLIDLVIQEETGQSITAHAMNLGRGSARPHDAAEIMTADSAHAPQTTKDLPINIAQATSDPYDYDLPVSLLMFTDETNTPKTGVRITRV